MSALSRALLVLSLFAVAASSGCSSFWHDMQPHRLHRMNRGPAMPSGSEVYSSCETDPRSAA